MSAAMGRTATDRAPLSAQQEAFLAWMHGAGGLRHPAPVAVAVRVGGELHVPRLGEALAEVARRHEALRTVFERGPDGALAAVVLDACAPELRWLAARGAGPAERLADARRLACRERERPFDLERGPLLRAAAIELSARDHVLLLAAHHLVCDAWSMGVLLRELGILYSALRTGRAARRWGPAMQCSEVVAWSRSRWPAAWDRWEEMLAGAPAGLACFPGRRPAARLAPRALDLAVDGALAGRVRTAARAWSATPFMVVLAAWSAVLSSWSGATDLVLMSPVAGRTRPGSESAVGCLFTSLLIRVDLAGWASFPELVARARSATLRVLQVQDCPCHELGRRFPHAPVLGYQGWDGGPRLPGFESSELELPLQLVDDLEVPGAGLGVPHLSVMDRRDGPMRVRLLFNEAAFELATVEQLGRDLAHLLGREC
jgi:hypothetical protein